MLGSVHPPCNFAASPEVSMIEHVNVLRASIGKYLFAVGYFDPDKKHQKGYLQTTKYGSETEVRELLKSSGVPDAEIDQLFERAKL